MLSFFQDKLFFGDVFSIEQQQPFLETFLACFYAFLISDRKSRFSKVYSLCLVANFDNFSIALIFRILAVFWSPFFAWNNYNVL